MVFADALLAQRLEAARAANAGVVALAARAVLEWPAAAPFSRARIRPHPRRGYRSQRRGAEAQIGAVDTFFRSRGRPGPPSTSAPWPAGLLQALGERGYCRHGVQQRSGQAAGPLEIVLTPRVRRALAGEDDPWSYAVGRDSSTSPSSRPKRWTSAAPSSPCPERCAIWPSLRPAPPPEEPRWPYAWPGDPVRRQPPSPVRCHGLHRELIAARLNEAIAQGCDMATASTAPAGVSQRNYERAGFEVVYTKVDLGGVSAFP